MIKNMRYTPHPGNTFPRDTDPRPVLEEGHIYTIEKVGESTVKLVGIKGGFPKYAFTDVKVSELDHIQVSITDYQKNAVALLKRWLDREQGRVMGGLFLTLEDDTEACLNVIYADYPMS